MNIMTGVTQLLAKSLEKTMLNNLGETTIRKIQDRLFERYGMSITQSMEEFEKLDSVLREFFGAGAEGLERKFLDSLCSIKSKKDQSQTRFTILEPSIGQSILKAYSDDEASKILNASIGESWTILEMLEKLQIPQTSGYRKVNSLIEDGLLIKDGHMISASGRKTDKYKSLFDNVEIDIKNNKVIVNVQFTQNVIDQSPILQTVYGI
jgi:hypothetical protein